MSELDPGRVTALFLLQVPLGALLGGLVALLGGSGVVRHGWLAAPVERVVARRWSVPTRRQVLVGYVGLGSMVGVPFQVCLGAVYLFAWSRAVRYGGMSVVVLLVAVSVVLAADRLAEPRDRTVAFRLSWSTVSLLQAVLFGVTGWLLFVLSGFATGVFRLL